MRFRTLMFALMLGAGGCTCIDDPKVDGGIIAPKPKVFITVQSSTIIGTKIKGTTTVSGCSSVTGVDILAADQSFITNGNYVGNPSNYEIDPSLLNRFYAADGFALPLSLVAKVTCDDGRTNLSQPAFVTFLPVASVVSEPSVQKAPDSFVAEGGLGGTATTFVGCIGFAQGRSLARIDANGTIIKENRALPFPCSYYSTITERSKANFTRWLMEPGVGAFAFDQDLTITNQILGPLKQIAVATDSSAVFWLEDIDQNQLIRANTTPAGPGQPTLWSVEFPAEMNSTPVIDNGNGWVYTSSFQYRMGSGVGVVTMVKYALSDGTILNATGGFTPALLTQNFGLNGNKPLTPQASFNIDGTLLYLAVLSFDANQNITTNVLACATGAGGCENTSRRWASPIFPTIVNTVVPFSNGNFIAAASSTEVYFLSSTDGSIRNLGTKPQIPTGSLRVKALQPGRGADFYMLDGPATDNSYPNEIIAIDSPMNGLLWQVSTGGGETPTNGMFIATDDSGQPWLRVGNELIKPLKNTDYRTARGATPLP